METARDAKDRAKAAWTAKMPYERQLRDIYRYVMPYRDTTGLFSVNSNTEAADRTDAIFDSTASNAAFRFAGRLQSELTPLFQPFFDMVAGPLIPAGDEKKQLTEQLQLVAGIVNGVLNSGTFHMRSHEMYLDLFAGTGAMLVLPGNERELVRYRTVPIAEIAMEDGPYGDIWGVDWRRKYKAKHLRTMWPKGTYSDTLSKKISDKPNDDVVVHQNTMYDPEEDCYCLKVWAEGDRDDAIIWEEDFRVNPWITPRFFVVPGEVYGRGPAHLALPTIKTTNKVQELSLLGAAFAVMPLWARRNDGVFNPDMAKFEPLAMWQVGSTGGPLGPSIQRLDVPHNLDVSHWVLEDQRMQMKASMFDNALPPDAGAVRSATEITERMKMLSLDFGGVFGRLTLEIVKPLVQRTIDILEQKGKLNTNIKIDQLNTMVRVIAPIAIGQQAEKVDRAVKWLQLTGMLGGAQATTMVANIEELFPEMGRWLGVDERFIRSDADSKALQQMAGQLAAQNQAAVQQGAQKASASQQAHDQAQSYLNGGGA